MKCFTTLNRFQRIQAFPPRFFSLLGFVAISLQLAACGGYNTQKKGNSSYASYDYPYSNYPTTGTSSPLPTDSPKGVAPYKYLVRGIGYNSVSIKVQTRSTLKVRFTPGLQDQKVSGSDLLPQYSGLGVYITVGESTQATPFLYNGLNGSIASSDVLDFTGRFTSACEGSSTQCRTSVTITIAQPNYNYWCITRGQGCPWTHVSDEHPWNGSLTIQTDDTDAL